MNFILRPNGELRGQVLNPKSSNKKLKFPEHTHRQEDVPPKSLLGKAVKYACNQWDRLDTYIEHADVTLDNNMAENTIRPFVIGRKNWLFNASPKGAAASAAIYSLIETAKANGLEPYWYLRHVIEKLPDAMTKEDFLALLPQNLDPSQLAGPPGYN